MTTVPEQQHSQQQCCIPHQQCLHSTTSSTLQPYAAPIHRSIQLTDAEALCLTALPRRYYNVSVAPMYQHQIEVARPMLADLANRTSWAFQQHVQRRPVLQFQQPSHHHAQQQQHHYNGGRGAPPRPRGPPPRYPMQQQHMGKGGGPSYRKPAPAYLYMVCAHAC